MSEAMPPFILYAPTLRTILIVSGSVCDELRAGHFPAVITTRLKEKLPHSLIPAIPPVNAFHLGIGLTRNCTLKCSYCHADANKSLYATRSTIAAALDHAFKAAAVTPRRALSVSFSFAVGGEPTMPWMLLNGSAPPGSHSR
jgi:sulfatase maturation enzyme AslB (radical SAM superfamily)